MNEIELDKLINYLSNSIREASESIKTRDKDISYVPVSMNISMPVHLSMVKETPVVRFRSIKEDMFTSKPELKTNDTLRQQTTAKGIESDDVTIISLEFKAIPGNI